MAQFYSSNFDKYIIPKEEGWYIQYTNYSGDTSFIKSLNEPNNKEEAFNIVNKVCDQEEGQFEIDFYAYNQL